MLIKEKITFVSLVIFNTSVLKRGHADRNETQACEIAFALWYINEAKERVHIFSSITKPCCKS